VLLILNVNKYLLNWNELDWIEWDWMELLMYSILAACQTSAATN